MKSFSDVMITIRKATESDWPAVWTMFHNVAASGDVFAYDETTTEEVARKLWFRSHQQSVLLRKGMDD